MTSNSAPLFARRVLAAKTALIFLCLILAGCASSPKRPPPAFERTKAHLLYLQPSPHPRMYVEVDAVAGCEPKEEALQKLREMLSKYCDKPDGIEIVRSDVIPRATARGVSPHGLARKYLNGPANTNTSSAAFLYVLYYDDTLHRYSAATRFLHRGANPSTEV